MLRRELLAASGAGTEIEFLASGVDSSDSAIPGPKTYSWSGVNLGDPHPDRMLVMICASQANVVIAGATIAGVGGTALATPIGNEGATTTKSHLSIFYASVPTGTSGTVSFNLGSGNIYRGGYALYRMVGFNMTPHQVVVDGTVVSALQADVSCNVAADGAIIVGASWQNGGGSTFTGVTEYSDDDMETNDTIASGMASGLAAETGRTVTIDCALTPTNGVGAAVSFKPL